MKDLQKYHIQYILSHFGIDFPVKKFHKVGFEWGFANEDYYIEAGDSYYFLRISGEKRKQEDYDLEFSVLRSLYKAGIKVPYIFETKMGESYFEGHISKRLIQANLFLYIFSDGSWNQIGHRSLKDIISNIKRMHDLLRNYKTRVVLRKVDRIKDYFKYAKRAENLLERNLLGLKMNEQKKLRTLLNTTHQKLEDYHKNKNSSHFPKQLIHSDLNVANFFIQKRRLQAIIDFESLGVGSVVDDWALFCVEWFRKENKTLSWKNITSLIGTSLDKKTRNVLIQDLYFRSIAYTAKMILSYFKKNKDPRRFLYPVWCGEKVEKLEYLLSL